MKEEKVRWSENPNIKQVQWLFLTFVGFCGIYAMAELVNFYGLLFWGWWVWQCQKKLYKWEVME